MMTRPGSVGSSTAVCELQSLSMKRPASRPAECICVISAPDPGHHAGMKTHQIEIQRLKAINHDKGSIELRVDALVLPSPRNSDDTREPSTVISLSEKDARSLLILLKGKLADLDKMKARSQR
jgi:hypothetical protein